MRLAHRRRWVWCAWCRLSQHRRVHPTQRSTFGCIFCARRSTWQPNDHKPWAQKVDPLGDFDSVGGQLVGDRFRSVIAHPARWR